MSKFNKDYLVAEVVAGKSLVKVSREFAGATIGYFLRDGDSVLKVNGKSFNSAIDELSKRKDLVRSYPRIKIEKGIKWQFACEYRLIDLTKVFGGV